MAPPPELAPPAALKRHPEGYLPVRTLNGWTLPYTMKGGVKEFHLVAEGRAYIRVCEETTPLSAGDIVLVPHGDPHVMGNGIARETIDATADVPNLLQGGVKRSRLGGSGERTQLICGYLACEARLIQPVLAGLPRVLRVHVRTDRLRFDIAAARIVHARAGLEVAVVNPQVGAGAVAHRAESIPKRLSRLPARRCGADQSRADQLHGVRAVDDPLRAAAGRRAVECAEAVNARAVYLVEQLRVRCAGGGRRADFL